MNFKNMSYTAYLSTGEIVEGDKFRSVWEYARFTARNYDGAAVIFRNSDNSCVCSLWFGFAHLFIWRGDSELKNKKALLRATYENDEYGRFCWQNIAERT